MQLQYEYNLNNPLENEKRLSRDNYTIFVRIYGTITVINVSAMHTNREIDVMVERTGATHTFATQLLCRTFLKWFIIKWQIQFNYK